MEPSSVLNLNRIVNLIFDSPKKQGQKRDMKCIWQDGISIFEYCFLPCENRKFRLGLQYGSALEQK